MEEIFNEVKVNEYKIGSLWRSFYSSIVALLLSDLLNCLVLLHNEILERYKMKEFHMLAHIGITVKLWFSVLSNLKSHIIHPKRTNDDVPSNL